MGWASLHQVRGCSLAETFLNRLFSHRAIREHLGTAMQPLVPSFPQLSFIFLRAAFQYGIKMSEGRKTRRFKETNDKAELDRQWKKISAVSEITSWVDFSWRRHWPTDAETGRGLESQGSRREVRLVPQVILD